MAFLNYTNHQNEKNLINRLTKECIWMQGVEFIYIPKNYIKDHILGEAKSSTYTNAYQIDGILSDNNYWLGSTSDNMTKFGVLSDNSIVVEISIKAFQDLKIPGRTGSLLSSPLPGDLLYIPWSSSYFEINDFDPEMSMFYSMGQKTIFTLTCSIFRWNYEDFQTNNSDVDSINTLFSNEFEVSNASNDEIKTESNTIRDNSINNIFGGL